MCSRRNEMVLRIFGVILLEVLLISMATSQVNKSLPATPADCQLKIHSCTRLVRPMLNDARYMFPTTLTDVDTMCKMWSHFVECVRRYMSSCSTEDQRSKFNKAVSHSMDTVHAICSSDSHQKDYLENAHCFRRVSVHSCGRYYRPLVTQVANRNAEDTHICCAYGQFKGCVSTPLLRYCGIKVHALLDHSLSYLVSTCSNTFYPLSYKCPTAPPPSPLTSLKTTTPMSLPSTTDSLPTSSSTDYSTSTMSRPRTIIYTLPPTQDSRTSFAQMVQASWWIMIWLIFNILFDSRFHS